jgi:hypothetical protein
MPTNNGKHLSGRNHSNVEEKLKALNLILPEPIKTSSDMKIPPSWIRVRDNKALSQDMDLRIPMVQSQVHLARLAAMMSH